MDNKIQEMARSMCRLSASLKCSECSDQCQYNDFAERLYNKGYRTASEVAMEITAEIEKALDNSVETEHFKGSWFNLNKFMQRLAELKKKYTEEGK